MGKKLSVWEKIKAYRLKNNVYVLIFVFVIFIASLILYFQPFCQDSPVWSNIALALFTSLLATIFAMCAEIIVQYKTHENDAFLEDIHTFGIANLNIDKEELLKDLLQECDRTIWISGYRLILTKKIKGDIAKAIERGAEVTALLCPPWSQGFKLVYGENEKVMDNYFEVFHAIRKAGKGRRTYNIFFTDKPLFSDTYKIDQKLVTGPYMHNRDEEYHHIMAKDFFSYNLVKNSKLYNLIEDEYLNLCEESVLMLDWDKFAKAYEDWNSGDYREEEKRKILRDACVTVEAGSISVEKTIHK